MVGNSSRMLSLLSLLQTRRDWPGPLLADRLGVTARTVRRDVDRLRELGYSVVATRGPEGGYRLAPGTDLPPLLFDDEQAVAIAVALQGVTASGVDLDEAAARALATVRQVMPSRLRHRVDGIRFTAPPPVDPVDPAVLEVVSAATRDARVLRFRYDRVAVPGADPAPGDETAGTTAVPSAGDLPAPPRRVEPHGVVLRGGRWYLLAWDLDRDDWRVFRLDRVHPRSPGGAPFARRPLPGPDAAAVVAARAKGSADADRWPCEGVVDLELPPREVAPWVADGLLEARGEHRSRLTIGSWSWAGVLAAALRFDAPFTVVGPPELRAAAEVAAARLRGGSA